MYGTKLKSAVLLLALECHNFTSTSKSKTVQNHHIVQYHGGAGGTALPSKPFDTDWGKIVLKALTIRGIYGRQMYDTWYKMLAMLDNGLDMTEMITHRFSCDEYQEAFDVMLTGECGKVILDWE